MSINADIIETIGHTPLIRIKKLIDPAEAQVFLKMESHNPYSSVKDRIGIAMISDAERRGLLTTDTVIVEPTSGNTGIALAFVCRIRKYRLILTMPESMSIERRTLLKALGAELVLTPAGKGMRGSVEKAEELVASFPKSWMPQQFENPANPAAHEATTGPEIWEASGGGVDAIVTGVGTGGTITGITRYIRRINPQFEAYAVEPADSPVISGGKPGPHKIQGIGAGFMPQNLDASLLSGVVPVENDEAFDWARRLVREEGVFAGISTGANICAVAKAIKKFNLKGKRIVTVAASFGERYLSTPLYSDTN
ncbi:MAG: cysteine synthase A [Kiritimatiellia bacterium]